MYGGRGLEGGLDTKNEKEGSREQRVRVISVLEICIMEFGINSIHLIYARQTQIIV